MYCNIQVRENNEQVSENNEQVSEFLLQFSNKVIYIYRSESEALHTRKYMIPFNEDTDN